MLQEYEQRASELNDEDYKKVEVTPCDVKEIQNTPKGVPGFWLRAILNHPGIGRLVQEKDRPIMMFLQDITCKLHEDGFGFDIIFTFEKNDYFKNTQLKKTYKMTKQNIIEKCEGTTIEWGDGKNVTEKKVKKKSKNKKSGQSKTTTKTVEQDSFFNYFKTIEMPDEKQLQEQENEEEKDMGEKMDEDFDLGNEFKDQLIPLALEYYMEVIEDEGDDECDSCDDDHHHHDKDSDEEDQPKGKGKKKGGNKKAEQAEGAEGK
jgi:nucleosome assembly protein 1-like 1